MQKQPLPLAGLRVIDYTHFLAGPYLSRCLAGMGAEVIKVERPKDGDAGRHHPYFIDGQSGYFLQQNMGKKGLCVNLKDPRGHKLMLELARTADVFVENYRPGALEKVGLGYEALSKINPRLVYCSVSAYGHTGPDASRPGFRRDRRSEKRRDGDDRRSWRAPAAVPHAHRRHVCRHSRRGGRLRRAHRSRDHRQGKPYRHGALRLHGRACTTMHCSATR